MGRSFEHSQLMQLLKEYSAGGIKINEKREKLSHQELGNTFFVLDSCKLNDRNVE